MNCEFRTQKILVYSVRTVSMCRHPHWRPSIYSRIQIISVSSRREGDSTAYHIHASQALYSAVHEALDIAFHRYVAVMNAGLSSQLRNQVRDFQKLMLCSRKIVQRHVESVISESQRNGAPNSRSGACNNRDASRSPRSDSTPDDDCREILLEYKPCGSEHFETGGQGIVWCPVESTIGLL